MNDNIQDSIVKLRKAIADYTAAEDRYRKTQNSREYDEWRREGYKFIATCMARLDEVLDAAEKAGDKCQT